MSPKQSSCHALLYVSRALLTREQAPAAIDAILAISSQRNAMLGVTGALVFTEAHFAQILEGPEASIDELMASICQDPRHHEVRIVDSGLRAARRFAGWDLAYAGPSFYVASRVRALVNQDGWESRRAVDALIEMMAAFAGRLGEARR